MIWAIIILIIYDLIFLFTTETDVYTLLFGNLFVIVFSYLLIDGLSKKSVSTFQDGLVDSSKNA